MNSASTNATGGFRFDGISFLGEASLLLNAQNKKGEGKGEIVLYSVYRDPIQVDYKEKTPPPFIEKQANTFKEQVYKKSVLFNVANETVLDEVLLVGKKKEKKSNSIGKADYVKVFDDKTPRFSRMSQLIQFSVSGVIVSGGSIRFSRSSGQALILLDNAEINLQILEGLSTDDVDRIEWITSAGTAAYGSRGGNGVILIYTKEGTTQKKANTKAHTVAKEIEGFNKTRVFYSPNYDDPKTKQNKTPDIRNTIYWNPYIHPDENGNNEFSYFNSDVSTDVNVTLEGVTDKGIPVVVRTSYNVDKNVDK